MTSSSTSQAPTYGDATAALLHGIFDQGVTHAVVFMRHSARTFLDGVHDLENQLTPQGREYSTRLGGLLPAGLTLRGYSSPVQRCVDTAELVLAGYSGGSVTRTRPMEALGVFYALDQQRMWKGMSVAGGMQSYLQQWFAGQVPTQAVMPPAMAANVIVHVLADRLANPIADKQLDVCVSHDISVHLVREALLGQVAAAAKVEFLDALVLYQHQGELWLTSHLGPAQVVSADLLTS